MPWKARTISVGTTPVVIASATVAAGDTAALTLAGASLLDTVPVVVQTTSLTPIWLGGSSMTTASTMLGMQLVASSTSTPNNVTFNLMASDPLFAITTGAAVVITVLGGRQS